MLDSVANDVLGHVFLRCVRPVHRRDGAIQKAAGPTLLASEIVLVVLDHRADAEHDDHSCDEDDEFSDAART